VVLGVRDNVLRIPTPALIEGKNVLVYDPATHKAVKRSVRTGIGNWDYTEVLEGLAPGDQVITSIDRAGVVDGARVEVEKPGAPPAK